MAGRIASIPEWIWAPLSARVLSAIIGATGIWVGLPWLFPSLGPTIFLQAHKPGQPSAGAFNVIVGHASGIAAATSAVLAVQAGTEPSVLSSGILTWPRMWASVIALALTLLVQIPLRASHPPAAATAMLIALGGFSLNGRDMLILAAGILLTAALGEGVRRLRETGP